MVRNERRSAYDVPASLTSQETLREWERLAKRETEEISRDIYRGTTKVDGKTVHECVETLVKMYHGKCAYCESVEHAPDIEHYRPKKRVTKVKGHKGYYWLAYEWSNLIPACTFCNSRGGKWNKFPVQKGGTRRFNPPMQNGKLDKEKCGIASQFLQAERPLLLHPEHDFIDDPFEMDEHGKFTGKEERAWETIRICDLNRRNLLTHRKKIVEDVFNLISKGFLKFNLSTVGQDTLETYFGIIYETLEEKTHRKVPFSCAAKYIFDHFETLIGNKFTDPDQHAAVVKSFKKYRKGTL